MPRKKVTSKPRARKPGAAAGATTPKPIDTGRWPSLAIETFKVPGQIRLGASPDCSHELIMSVIERAEKELLLYIYDLSSVDVIGALRKKRSEGVVVKIQIDGKSGGDAEISRLKQAGLEYKLAASTPPRSVFKYCHQKFIVADNRELFLGSGNWGASALPVVKNGAVSRKCNREWFAAIENRDLAVWFKNTFWADWRIPEDRAVPLALRAIPPQSEFVAPAYATRPLPALYPIGVVPAADPVSITPVMSPDNFGPTMARLIGNASRRVWVQQQYITSNKAGDIVDDLVVALRNAKGRGVDVRVMASSRFDEPGQDSWDKTIAIMKANKLQTRFRAINLERFEHLHNKGVIVDDAVVVTSTNWSVPSIQQNREAGLLIESAVAANYFARMFEDDWNGGWTIARALSAARAAASAAATHRSFGILSASDFSGDDLQ